MFWHKLKYSLDVNRAVGHLRYVFILTTLGTSNNFTCFLSFFGAVSEKTQWKSVTSTRN